MKKRKPHDPFRSVFAILVCGPGYFAFALTMAVSLAKTDAPMFVGFCGVAMVGFMWIITTEAMSFWCRGGERETREEEY